MTERQAVLIVEDERLVARDLQRTLQGFGYDAFAIAASAEEALARAQERCPAVVLMDIRIRGDLDGIETAKLIRARFACAVVYLTAHADSDTLERATATAPHGYLQKPVRPAELRSAIEISLHKRRSEERWQEGQRWVETALDTSGEAVVALSEDGVILDASRTFCAWLSTEAAELRGQSLRKLIALMSTASTDRLLAPDELALLQNSLQEGDAMLNAHGQQRRVRYRAQPVWHGSRRLGALLIMSDRASAMDSGPALLARQDIEQQLQRSLREKEQWIQEIQHRVKNNLQVVASLLRLQAMHVPDPGMQRLFSESENRVQSIALVHAQLHQSDQPTRVQFEQYTESLMRELLRSHGALGRGIEYGVSGGDLSLRADQAVPCGLIINELVSNALRYAFPAGRPGTIMIELSRHGDQLQLCVRDDGVGLPPGTDPRGAASLGLDLVFTLADQLGARVDWTGTAGTSFTFRFSEK
jgi:two-component sensor histidine kinase/CheY-like chemotaxis protein